MSDDPDSAYRPVEVRWPTSPDWPTPMDVGYEVREHDTPPDMHVKPLPIGDPACPACTTPGNAHACVDCTAIDTPVGPLFTAVPHGDIRCSAHQPKDGPVRRPQLDVDDFSTHFPIEDDQ